MSRTVQPERTRSRMVSHIWPRVRGSSPVVGSSRKISGGRVSRLAARSSLRRMPPENAEIGLVAASVRSNCSSSSAPRVARLGARHALEAGEEPEVLGRGEVLVDRGELPGDAEQPSYGVGLGGDVVAEDLGPAAVDVQQGGEHPEHRGLAGAVGAEDAEDLAAVHLEVDAVHGALVAELLDEPGRTDGQVPLGSRSEVVVCGHAGKRGARRFHRGCAAPSPVKPADGWIGPMPDHVARLDTRVPDRRRPRRGVRRLHRVGRRPGARALPPPGRGGHRAARRQPRHPRHADRLGEVDGRRRRPRSPRLPATRSASTPRRSRRW